MDIQQAILGTLIALLRRQLPPILIREQIMEGVKEARRLFYLEAINSEAGDEPTYESPICEINSITANLNYQTIVSKTITAGRTAKIARVEMACKQTTDYEKVLWRLTVNSRYVFEDKTLPTSLTLDLAEVDTRGGKEVKVEAKTTVDTAEVWADITGKEVY